MPCCFTTLDELELIYLRYFGIVTCRDILQSIDDMLPIAGDGQYDKVLTGLRDLQEFQIAEEDLAELGHIHHGLVRRQVRPFRSAIWAPGEQAFDTATRYKSSMPAEAGERLTVERTLGGALTALGIAPDAALMDTLLDISRPEMH